MDKPNPIPAEVSPAFDRIAPDARHVLLEMRDLILDVAQSDPRIGTLHECLRWGEPAYLTQTRKTGTTIRLGVEKGTGKPAVFFNCRTTLVEEFRQQFGPALRYVKNRAVLIGQADAESREALRICVASALTYHLRKT